MIMLNIRLSAAVLGGLLSISTFHAAYAACAANDLAGAWSMYASHYVKPTTAQPTVMRCNVTLTQTTSMHYNIGGTCLDYQASADVPISLTVRNGNLTETAACKLTGTFQIGANGIFPTATVLDARINGTTPKGHISGIARVFMGSDNYQLLDFRLER